jgi:hypothetical protein
VTDLFLHKSRKLNKDEKLAEGQKLSRAYRAAVREQRDELRTHYPEPMREIDECFRAGAMIMLPELTKQLLAKLNAIDIAPSYRPILLNYLSAHLSGLCERAGLPTFSDPLPDEPDNAFIQFRRLLADH